jgi:UDP-glucose 4-epimerase
MLTKSGYQTLVCDNLTRGHKEFTKWGVFVEVDLGNYELLKRVFFSYPIRAVIHFAGYAYVGESVFDPQSYYLNNVRTTLNLLQVMLEYNVKLLIFSSTCSTYGNPMQIPMNESHPQSPVNPYGWSKLMIERILKDYSAAYDLKHVSLRYFNAAGADPDTEIGEWHEPETHLIPLVLDVAAGRREDVKIFGTNHDTPDGTCIRDYVHVTDLAMAHKGALEFLLDGGHSEVFNLANGNGFSVREVIRMAECVTGAVIKTVDSDRRHGDPAILIGNSEKARQVLRWNPRYSDLEKIIETSWNWHKGSQYRRYCRWPD